MLPHEGTSRVATVPQPPATGSSGNVSAPADFDAALAGERGKVRGEPKYDSMAADTAVKDRRRLEAKAASLSQGIAGLGASGSFVVRQSMQAELRDIDRQLQGYRTMGSDGLSTTPAAPGTDILITPPADHGPDILVNIPSEQGPDVLINRPLAPGSDIVINLPPDEGPSILINVPSEQGQMINPSRDDQRLPLDQGAMQWARRHPEFVLSPKEAGVRAHQIKQSDNMQKPTSDFSVDPETGDVYDPEGEIIGNLGESQN